jgi:geranylgeranyl reductase family protein
MHDLLVIGGGPAGASAASWAAGQGLDVVIVERRAFPREKTCGDALTPRAVRALHDMGLGGSLAELHRVQGLRLRAHRRSVDIAWPEHAELPATGYVVRRSRLDSLVVDHAVQRGAQLRQQSDAVAPVVRNGLVVGAVVRDLARGGTDEVAARYVIVADGANSRVGRALGAVRDRTYPQGMAIRAYFASSGSHDAWLESTLDVRDRSGAALPGIGWVFPGGDGTVNVGVGLVSTYRDWTSVNTTRLLSEFAATLADRWHLDPAAPLAAPVGGRLPMGGSIGPKAGPNWLLAGDAAGSVNPFNGDGIATAYETGRLAAMLVAEALASGNGLALQQYPSLLDARYGLYNKMGRVFTRAIGHPALIRELTRVGVHSRSLLEWAVRVMTDLVRPDEHGPAEAAYRALATMVRLVPEPSATRG